MVLTTLSSLRFLTLHKSEGLSNRAIQELSQSLPETLIELPSGNAKIMKNGKILTQDDWEKAEKLLEKV